MKKAYDKKTTPKTIVSYFDKIKNTLIESSNLSSTLNHAVSIGTAREVLIQDFLQKILPENIHLCSGQIFNTNDTFSGQIDIVLSPKSHPKLQISENIALFPLESSIGAIEVKSNLTTAELSKCLKICKELSDLTIENNDNAKSEKHNYGTSYSIFAYDGCKYNTILKTIDDFVAKNQCKYHSNDLPDIVLVLKRGFMLKKYNFRNHPSSFDVWKNAKTSYEIFNEDILFQYFKYLIELINDSYKSNDQISFKGYESAYKKRTNLF